MKTHNYSVWSNFFFLLPLYLSLTQHLYFSALVISFSLVSGIVYHSSRESSFLYVDRAAAWLLILNNLILAYLGDFNRPYFPLALVCLILALYYHYVPGQRKEYAVRHSLWHLFGALITVFCILTRVGQF